MQIVLYSLCVFNSTSHLLTYRILVISEFSFLFLRYDLTVNFFPLKEFHTFALRDFFLVGINFYLGKRLSVGVYQWELFFDRCLIETEKERNPCMFSRLRIEATTTRVSYVAQAFHFSMERLYPDIFIVLFFFWFISSAIFTRDVSEIKAPLEPNRKKIK